MPQRLNWNKPRDQKKILQNGHESIAADQPEERRRNDTPPKYTRAEGMAVAQAEEARRRQREANPFKPEYLLIRKEEAGIKRKKNTAAKTNKKIKQTKRTKSADDYAPSKSPRMTNVQIEFRPLKKRAR